jgi:hypothetical protein
MKFANNMVSLVLWCYGELCCVTLQSAIRADENSV